MRGEAALKARLPKEARKNASISPYERGIAETHWPDVFRSQPEEQGPPCAGELLQHTRKGNWTLNFSLGMLSLANLREQI